MERITDLLSRMTLEEKIGQMAMVNADSHDINEDLYSALRDGRIGSTINQVDAEINNKLQRIAVEDSRLGIPLLVGRDVIHGFRTIMPIPLGQAATWNPDLLCQGARVAAVESASAGINWTFAPVVDVSRDPRWGRIAETLGEDPYLTSVLGAAVVRGYQGDDLSLDDSIAACAKHFAGYGATEAGRDYNTANIPEIELRNVYLPSFKAMVDAGVATLMASFSDLNGIPPTGNQFLMRQILRDEWGFEGPVVSDWESIEELVMHGLCSDNRSAAQAAAMAGINIEMASSAYADHLPELVKSGEIDIEVIDEMVASILELKLKLGLFEQPYTDPHKFPDIGNEKNIETARRAALQSLVLLENRDNALPLSQDAIRSLAIVGPLADQSYEQMGTWVFDGDDSISETPLNAIRAMVGDSCSISYVPAMETSRSQSTDQFEAAYAAAKQADATVVFLGEESILSGEAHSLANIELPGNQAELVRLLHSAGKPVIAVVLAGRPLALGNIIDLVDALVFAWHPGSMGGPAIADILFGVESPSGKLPITFPKMVGQVPIYYAHKNTGRPASPDLFVHIDDIEPRTPQLQTGMSSHHLDAGYEPMYHFGYGLSYTRFEYSQVEVLESEPRLGQSITVRANVKNTGKVEAEEVVQLYLRDLVGSVTRPVRELKGFQRIRLKPGETRQLTFLLKPGAFEFFGQDMKKRSEAGKFNVWVGGDSNAMTGTEFELT
ncbi:MAG TPA: beta-glucosidase BglX [Xanthomonadales bacterium]|nr:beta-glucosidase BglX [Xanthomonadales bacterium]